MKDGNMNPFEWSIWRLAFSWELNGVREYVGMNKTHYALWRHIGLGLWFRWATRPHHGRYWQQVHEDTNQL